MVPVLVLDEQDITMKTNPFFVIGTVGMIVSAALHMFVALVLKQTGAHAGFFALYPTFTAFLVMGFGQMVKKPEAKG